ncbi:MAG: hypothetical protein U1E73_03970 [Planctomycetota bacterium]
MSAMAKRLAALLLTAGAAVAQNARDQAEEYSRLQRQSERNRAEVQRLVDRRMALDLGLPTPPDPFEARQKPLSTEEKEHLFAEARGEEARVAESLTRFNELKTQLERLQQDVAARTALRAEDEYVTVPSPGSAQRRETGRPTEAVDHGGGAAAGRSPEEPIAAPPGQADVAPLGRVRGQIKGSSDHLQVAQGLFKAGQVLMQRAEQLREHGDAEGASTLDDRAKQYLGRAIAELAPLLAAKEPSYSALFCQGRSLELLFRYAERYEGLTLQGAAKLYQQREQEVREPFLAIAARDVTKTGARGETEVLGPWGTAAQAAVSNFRWINQYGSYQPSTPIAAITWPGEKKSGKTNDKQQQQ